MIKYELNTNLIITFVDKSGNISKKENIIFFKKINNFSEIKDGFCFLRDFDEEMIRVKLIHRIDKEPIIFLGKFNIIEFIEEPNNNLEKILNLLKKHNWHKLEIKEEEKNEEMIKNKNLLDKYYTKPEIAKLCYKEYKKILLKFNMKVNNSLFVEPSAGGGAFLECIDNTSRRIGFDIEPERKNIIKLDFLEDGIKKHINQFIKDKNLENPNIVFIGNPPFGYKGNLAINFLNKSFDYTNIVGFIFPVLFRKYSIQRNINIRAKLIFDMNLPDDSFTEFGKDYKLRTCFQIWTLIDNDYTNIKNIRKYRRISTEHPDFIIYQYNCTKESEKYFDYQWDFAIQAQGYGDYKTLIYKKEECSLKKHWSFFKALTPEALIILKSIDFEKLSKGNTSTPGFRKTDVIQEYDRIKRSLNEPNTNRAT